ncbi:CoA transferase, partial [Escherichia coli]|nr:CoA transferase [Escherichia coli]
MTNNESKGPFEGLLVIDMTHVLNGPFGTQLLCNMGARVIKVEPPGNDSNLLIVFYVQIMPDDFVMQLHR